MVQIGRLVSGIVFLALFAGFELHIPAIENLIPGTYGSIAYTGYLGFGFLLVGITSLASAFSGPSRMQYPPQTAGPNSSPAVPDAATLAALRAHYQQSQPSSVVASGAKPVYCSSCGKPNQPGARFCQACATPLMTPTGPPAGGGAGP